MTEEKQKLEWNKNYLLIGMAVMVVITLILVFIQAFEVRTLTTQLAAKSSINAGSSGGQIDMTGWTENEKMMYQHHGTLPAKLTGNAVNSNPSSGMVGGC